MVRPCRYATPKVEEWRAIDLAELRRLGDARPHEGSEGWKDPGDHMEYARRVDKLGVVAKSDGLLFVRRDDQGQLGQLFVPFVFSPTKFGGQRTWFRCPGCGTGCRVLYGTNSLRCGRCRGLKYQSQYQAAAFRHLDRAHKIRRRLGKPSASGDPLPPKPHRMRWRTYRRLECLVLRLETARWAAMSAHVNRRQMR